MSAMQQSGTGSNSERAPERENSATSDRGEKAALTVPRPADEVFDAAAGRVSEFSGRSSILSGSPDPAVHTTGLLAAFGAKREDLSSYDRQTSYLWNVPFVSRTRLEGVLPLVRSLLSYQRYHGEELLGLWGEVEGVSHAVTHRWSGQRASEWSVEREKEVAALRAELEQLTARRALYEKFQSHKQGAPEQLAILSELGEKGDGPIGELSRSIRGATGTTFGFLPWNKRSLQNQWAKLDKTVAASVTEIEVQERSIRENIRAATAKELPSSFYFDAGAVQKAAVAEIVSRYCDDLTVLARLANQVDSLSVILSNIKPLKEFASEAIRLGRLRGEPEVAGIPSRDAVSEALRNKEGIEQERAALMREREEIIANHRLATANDAGALISKTTDVTTRLTELSKAAARAEKELFDAKQAAHVAVVDHVWINFLEKECNLGSDLAVLGDGIPALVDDIQSRFAPLGTAASDFLLALKQSIAKAVPRVLDQVGSPDLGAMRSFTGCGGRALVLSAEIGQSLEGYGRLSYLTHDSAKLAASQGRNLEFLPRAISSSFTAHMSDYTYQKAERWSRYRDNGYMYYETQYVYAGHAGRLWVGAEMWAPVLMGGDSRLTDALTKIYEEAATATLGPVVPVYAEAKSCSEKEYPLKVNGRLTLKEPTGS